MSKPASNAAMQQTVQGYRAAHMGPNEAVFERRDDGTIYVRSPSPLASYPARMTDRLEHWADVAPERIFFAERDGEGGWRTVTYAKALALVRSIGEALVARGLSPERPLAILSGNDIEHVLMALGAMYVGVPHAPISPAYSLVSSDYGKLRHIIDLLTPGMVFAADGTQFAAAIDAVVPTEVELVSTRNPMAGRPTTIVAELSSTLATAAVDEAHAQVGPDTIAKLLFTSGSTGLPKGVITTERMLCSNQVMLNTMLPFLKDEPPVIVDWLPWNHVFGGSHNVGLILFNGGSFYIDDGRPTPQGIAATVRNLREIAPTVYFNVPKGFEELVPHLRQDAELRKSFFSRLNVNFFAGAGLAQHVWDALDEIAEAECGERILMMTGLGATESAPFALVCRPDQCRSGYVGLPVPGVELKLAPVEEKLEARLRGPSITPGYWRMPEATAASYDTEGFYKLGDALQFIDPDDWSKGLLFDGRVTEDFKLSSGTWVSVGPLRARFLECFGNYAKDVVIAGLNRDAVTALVFPDASTWRALAPELAGMEEELLYADPRVKAKCAGLLAALAADSTGSSNRVVRAMLMATSPSIDRGEITDKGSINQRAVLSHRADLVDELYREPFSARVVTLG